jgi:hypothetical protein
MAHLRGVQEKDGSLRVPITESQAEIGARICGTRQMVNVVLKRWSRLGTIAMRDDGIHILKADALWSEARKTGFDIDEYLAGYHAGWAGVARQ